MNVNEIYILLVKVIDGIRDECKSRLALVPKERKTEQKALKIELGMYSLCMRAGCLYMTETNSEKEEAVLKLRTPICQNIMQNHFPHIYELYLSLDDEEKAVMLSALQAELFMRDQIYEGYKSELAAAKACGDEKNIFEFQIKVRSVERVFEAWEEWRKEHNIYPNLRWEV